MANLNVSAVILASEDSIRGGALPTQSQLNVGISISDAGGAPFIGLMESQVQIALTDGGGTQTPTFFFSQEIQDSDEDGPRFDEDHQPIIIRVPGPARSLGLAGFYLIILSRPDNGWIGPPFTAEVAIRAGGDCGQAFGSFVSETQEFRDNVKGSLEATRQRFIELLSAYAITGIDTRELKGFTVLKGEVDTLSNMMTRIGQFLHVPGF